MADAQKELAARRLRTAFDLHDAGVAMMRQTLRRKHPRMSDQELDVLLGRWLRDRPGAEFGDAEGRPGTWPRETSDE